MFDHPWLKSAKDGVYLTLHAQPGAKHTAFRGLHGEAVKVAVQQAPQDGKANRAIEKFLARALALPASAVKVVSGESSRSKRVFIEGDAEVVSLRLLDCLQLSNTLKENS